MDGNPNPKNKKWRGAQVSETRFYVSKWMEKELPLLSGSVLNIGAGNSDVPKTLLDFKKVGKYTTMDKKWYGDAKNKVDIYGDIQELPKEWTNSWDAVISIEVLECVPNLFKAMEETHRVLKPGGKFLVTCPFNYRFFGSGTGLGKKKNPVKDYWRVTRDGWEMLFSNFSSVRIEGFGGNGDWDRFCYCIVGTK